MGSEIQGTYTIPSTRCGLADDLTLMSARRTSSSSAAQDWCTPPVYVDAVKRLFRGSISLDPCSNPYSMVNAVTEYELPWTDGLDASWDYPTVYVNPPYGRDRERGTSISHWLKKCAETWDVYGSEILTLIPVAPNTSHWKNYVFGSAAGIAFLYDTRLKFWIGGSEHRKGAPQACAMVYWGDRYKQFYDVFIEYGAVVDIRPLLGQAIGQPASSISVLL